MVMTRFEYLVNELMRNNAMNRSTKVKLYEARNNVREAAGLAADLSVNDAIMSLRSLGKLMDLQGLEADEQLQALKSEWSEVDLQYLQVALENNKIFDVDDLATELASADFAATLRAQLQNLSGLTTDQLIAGLGQALQSGANRPRRGRRGRCRRHCIRHLRQSGFGGPGRRLRLVCRRGIGLQRTVRNELHGGSGAAGIGAIAIGPRVAGGPISPPPTGAPPDEQPAVDHKRHVVGDRANCPAQSQKINGLVL